MPPIYIVDAFTGRPFSGNPAAVCVLESPAEADWMQSVASEMNLSETAFVTPSEGGVSLRWFTPALEVELCGHATLASAHVLWARETVEADAEIEFDTLSGRLTARRSGDLIQLDFPAEEAAEITPPVALSSVLGLAPVFVGANRFDLLVELGDEQEVRSLKPDLSILAAMPYRGLIVTAPGGEYDFVSRFFGPAAGVDEDPVTGSAHCCLAPYWRERFGRSRMRAFQASARGGIVRVECAGDRVLLEGEAVTVVEGHLLVR